MKRVLLTVILTTVVLPFCGCEPYQAKPVTFRVFDYDVLYHIEKNPSKYVGKLYAFQGRVIQAQESKDGIVFQMLTGNWPGSYHTGPSLIVSLDRSDTPIVEKSWVKVLGHIGPPIEGQNIFGGYVSSLTIDAIAVLVNGTYYYSRLNKEIVEQWSSGELFSPKPKLSKSDLIPYTVINRDEYLPHKMSFDIRVNKVDGKFPTEKQLADISTYLRSMEKPHNRTFVCFYLPEMEVDEGAWATAHFNPDLKVWISYTNKVTEDASRHLDILADKYSDGNISFIFFSYDSKGNESWIGDGVLELSIKDKSNRIIKRWKKEIGRQGANYEIYMGAAIHSVRSMDAKFICGDGTTYTQKEISLKRLLD